MLHLIFTHLTLPAFFGLFFIAQSSIIVPESSEYPEKTEYPEKLLSELQSEGYQCHQIEGSEDSICLKENIVYDCNFENNLCSPMVLEKNTESEPDFLTVP